MLRGIAYRLFIVFLFLVGGVVEVSQQRPIKQVDMSLPEEVMPGSVLPQDSSCEWQYYRPGTAVYCRVWRKDVEIVLSYDQTHIVETAYQPAVTYTLGEIIRKSGQLIRWRK